MTVINMPNIKMVFFPCFFFFFFIMHTEPCTCSAWGDPHFTTCDGRNFDYQGMCVYKVAEDCRKDGFTQFRIFEENEPYRGNRQASVTKTLYVQVDENDDGLLDRVRGDMNIIHLYSTHKKDLTIEHANSSIQI